MAGYLDFFIDPEKNDIVSKNGKIVFATGSDETLNRIRTRIRIVQPEWFLNSTAGLPYFTQVFGRKDTGVFTLLLRQIIINTEGVESIQSLDKSINFSTRETKYDVSVVIQQQIYSLTQNFEVA